MMAIYNAIDQLYVAITGTPLVVNVETTAGRVTIQSLGATKDARKLPGTAAQAL